MTKKKTKTRKKILTVILGVLVVAVVVAANVLHSNSTVQDIEVKIDYQGSDTLIDAAQTAALIAEAMPRLRATKLRDVNLEGVEKAAARSPYLEKCEASTSISGAVVLYAVQRRPIVRIMIGASEYYLDKEGHRMPVSKRGDCNVIVAGGNIPDKGKGLEEVVTLARFLDEHEQYTPLFDQIYRNEKGDLYLTPKLGSHVVLVGPAENLEEKFRNLMVFYTQGLPLAGWDTYSQVNLKYRGQVVGTRK